MRPSLGALVRSDCLLQRTLTARAWPPAADRQQESAAFLPSAKLRELRCFAEMSCFGLWIDRLSSFAAMSSRMSYSLSITHSPLADLDVRFSQGKARRNDRNARNQLMSRPHESVSNERRPRNQEIAQTMTPPPRMASRKFRHLPCHETYMGLLLQILRADTLH
jgi:hypothetical protein